MFTGIVRELGVVSSVEAGPDNTRLAIEAPELGPTLSVGDSIAISGVCLTATATDGDAFTVDVVPETVSRTTLGTLAPGDAVNLERPVGVGELFDGHIVQGHVDAIGDVVSVDPEGESRRMRVEVPVGVSRYLVEKGSVTLDGVSLTVTDVKGSELEVALIPHTLAMTTLGRVEPGDAVNVEVDVLAKYVERLLEGRV